jgi:hypothetical protein
LAAVKLTTVQVDRHDLLCKAWTDRGLVCSAQRKSFKNMPYVRYVHLTKAKHIHKRQTHFLLREDVTHKDYDRKGSVANKNALWS